MATFKNLFSRKAPTEGEPVATDAVGSSTGSGSDLFASCTEQVENVRQWNGERAWDFSDSDLEQVADPSGWPESPQGGLITAVLVPYLADTADADGVQRTFDELWAVAAGRQPAALMANGLRSGPGYLRLLSGIEHTPGLRWEVIDLGANKGEDAVAVRDPATSPHAGMLAAACHHPAWVRGMNPFSSNSLPRVWLAGYDATMEIPEGFVRAATGEPARERPWQFIPGMFWDGGDKEIRVAAYDIAEVAHPDWGVPTFR